MTYTEFSLLSGIYDTNFTSRLLYEKLLIDFLVGVTPKDVWRHLSRGWSYELGLTKVSFWHACLIGMCMLLLFVYSQVEQTTLEWWNGMSLYFFTAWSSVIPSTWGTCWWASFHIRASMNAWVRSLSVLTSCDWLKECTLQIDSRAMRSSVALLP